jgi:hypothetical protein
MADNNNNNNNNASQDTTNELLRQLIEEQKKANKEDPPPPPPPPEPDPEPKFSGVFDKMLFTMQENLDFVMAKDAEDVLARRQARAEKRREAVSAGDEKKKSLRERISDSMSGAKQSGKDATDKLKNIGKFITKGLGLAIVAPMIVDFIGGLVDGAIKEAFGEEAAEKYGGMIKVGGILAVVGGLLFGPMAILPLFFAGVMGVLGKKLVDGISDETLDKFGIDKKSLGGVVAAVGAALGLFVPTLLKKAIFGAGRLALGLVTGTASLASKAVTAATGAITGTSAAAAGAGAGATPRPAGGGATPPRPGGVPSGMRVNQAGRVIHANTGRFASADDIARAMKAEGRMAKVAKYMKFFKFAGPAMAVVPALIDPLLAIYNDAGPREIKKQLVGALGTVGGVALGGLAGTALGTGIFPGVGSLLGGLVGAGAGAFLGEDLAEMIADAVLSGDDLDETAVKNAQKTRRNNRRRGRGNTSPSSVQVSNTDTSISPTPTDTTIAPTGTDVADAKVATLEDGTQIVLSGGGSGGNQTNIAKTGDTVNSTNVGGSNTTFNIVNNGNRSLSNSHLPVPQGF